MSKYETVGAAKHCGLTQWGSMVDEHSAARLLGSVDNTDCTDNSGLTPLMEATVQGLTEVVKMVLKTGCDVNEQHVVDGRAALHFAADGKNPRVVELLLRHGADANITDNWGNTPLHKACRVNDCRMITVLLERGACLDVDVRNVDGVTPVELSKATARNDLIESRPNCFEKHFIKLETVGFVDLGASVLESLRPEEWNPECEAYRRNCMEEIAKSHTPISHDAKVTYYDILSMKKETIADLGVEQVLAEENYLMEFPIYGGMIKIGLDSGRRRRLISQCVAVLLRGGIFSQLPIKAIALTCSFLSDIDLEVVSRINERPVADPLNRQSSQTLNSEPHIKTSPIHMNGNQQRLRNGHADSGQTVTSCHSSEEKRVNGTTNDDVENNIPNELSSGSTSQMERILDNYIGRFLILPVVYLLAGLFVGAVAQYVWPTH